MLSSSRHLLLATAAMAVAFGLSTAALAQSVEGETCALDADCATGLLCQVVGGSGCAAMACPAGSTCDPIPCEPVEYRACVVPPCTTDAECGEGLTCVVGTDAAMNYCEPKACVVDADCGTSGLSCIEQQWEECTGGTAIAAPCVDGESCPTPVPVDTTTTCQTLRTRFCGPAYMGDCTAAVDCGDGFECVPSQSCTCTAGSASGGGEVPPSAGGAGGATAVPVPTPDACTCETLETNFCQPLVIECTADADCPTDWACLAGATPTIACDPAAGACPEPAPVVSQCAPPVWGGVYYRGTATTDGGPVYALSGGETPTAPEVVPAPTTTDNGATSSSSSDHGGCQLAAASGTRGSALGVLFALVGLGALRRRR